MHSSNHAQGIVHQNESTVLYPPTHVPCAQTHASILIPQLRNTTILPFYRPLEAPS